MTFARGGMLLAAVLAAPAAATTRTWVSGAGNDTDPCSFAPPCKTFGDANAKTDAG